MSVDLLPQFGFGQKYSECFMLKTVKNQAISVSPPAHINIFWKSLVSGIQ